VASYRRALQIRPRYVAAHINLGIALERLGRMEEAEASCRNALQIKPDAATAVVILADLRADQGQFTQAEEIYRRAISIEPDLPEAWAGIARVRKMTSGDTAWLAEVQRIAEQHLAPRKEAQLHYAIGKYFDDVRDYEQAFAHYRRGNELARHLAPKYDKQHLTQLMNRMVHSYDRAWLSRTRIDANTSERPVFIIGMPRSGTTLAEQILASHPQVFGAGELTFWRRTAGAYQSSESALHMSASILEGLASEYLRLLQELSSDALRVVDKMHANYRHLGLIHAALPHARFIHMRRNPIDTCLSMFFQNFSIAHFQTDLEDLGHYYSEYRRVMDYWRSILPADAMLEVPYEGLVEDQETWSRKMLEFIGLPWDARCLEFHRTPRAVLTPSNWQVRQKITRSSVARWRNYEAFVGPLLYLIEPTSRG
jgi:tetratricopeptide (TPR) repeat protein